MHIKKYSLHFFLLLKWVNSVARTLLNYGAVKSFFFLPIYELFQWHSSETLLLKWLILTVYVYIHCFVLKSGFSVYRSSATTNFRWLRKWCWGPEMFLSLQSMFCYLPWWFMNSVTDRRHKLQILYHHNT